MLLCGKYPSPAPDEDAKTRGLGLRPRVFRNIRARGRALRYHG